MHMKSSLLGGAAVGVILAALALSPADAKPAHRHAHRAAASAGNAALRDEVKELKDEVASLQAWRDSQTSSQAQTQQQLAQLSTQLADAETRAQSAEQRATAAESQVQAEIQTIPGAVATQVAANKPKTDKLYYKGVSVVLGGFAAAEGVYRSRNNVADISSNYSKIPYNNNPLAHTDELRGTARQSRVSFLAQGDINPKTHASFYGEFDFQAGPQTANYNESNSFSPRIRNVYGALDWEDEGWHLLVGQNWSLATLNGKGVTPRNEVPPPVIDAQYVPGFAWTRQPQIRLVKDFDKTVWLAVSLENPQTTFGSAATGTGTTATGISVVNNAGCIGGCDSVNTPSFNHAPDVIGKVAFEPMIGGARPLHVEVYGLYRSFYDRVNSAAGNAAGNNVGITNVTTSGGGFGAGVTWTVVPKLLDVEGSVLTGRGIGRYGAGQLPDTIVSPNGSLAPIPETMFLVGGTVHATPALDLYVFGGEETEGSRSYLVGGKQLGYGNPNATLAGCFVEGGTCAPDTQQISQITAGLWDKVYNGSFGSVRVGLQYSHTDLRAFSGVGGRPATSDDMVFTSFRYYPF
ncbi:MAG: hypothetical protein ACHP84_17330 [Caulobacterales bacterium]